MFIGSDVFFLNFLTQEFNGLGMPAKPWNRFIFMRRARFRSYWMLYNKECAKNAGEREMLSLLQDDSGAQIPSWCQLFALLGSSQQNKRMLQRSHIERLIWVIQIVKKTGFYMNVVYPLKMVSSKVSQGSKVGDCSLPHIVVKIFKKTPSPGSGGSRSFFISSFIKMIRRPL